MRIFILIEAGRQVTVKIKTLRTFLTKEEVYNSLWDQFVIPYRPSRRSGLIRRSERVRPTFENLIIHSNLRLYQSETNTNQLEQISMLEDEELQDLYNRLGPPECITHLLMPL